jgi:phosphate transport system permease protein
MSAQPTEVGAPPRIPHPTHAAPVLVEPPEERRATGAIRRGDVFGILGSLAASVALTAWLATQLVALQGVLPFIAVSYLLFLLFYVVVTRIDHSWVAMRDRVASVFIHSIAVVLLIALGAVIIFTVIRGWDALWHVNFFTKDMSETGPLQPLTSGGVLYAMAGTLIMIAMALAISIPLGIATAVFLSEFPGRFARFVRTVVEAMTALPSIVAGLFIYATVILTLGIPRSGFAASLAITVMMLPIIIRSSDVVLRLVPAALKEASLALGAGTWRTVWEVVLPTARSGLTTAVILGTARGIGETSPVLLTAGLTTFFNFNPFSGAMVSMPLATFTFVKSPEPTMIARGFGAAAVLMVMVLVLFILARLIGGRGPGVLTPAQVRRRQARSRTDDYRFRRRELERANALAPAAAPRPTATLLPRLPFGRRNRP